MEKKNEIITAVDEIQGFGSIHMGSVSYTNGNGTANLNIKVKGNKKNISVNIYLEKSPDSDWVVIEIKY